MTNPTLYIVSTPIGNLSDFSLRAQNILAASGFIQPRTLFSGFMPKQKSEQFNEFEIWFQSSPCVAVFFESPRRVLETLINLKEFLTKKHCESSLNTIQICLSREMSKKFEEHKRISLEKIIEHLKSLSDLQGECVVTVDFPKIIIKNEITLDFAAKESILISKLNDLTLKSSCKTVAIKYSLSAKEIYALASQIKF